VAKPEGKAALDKSISSREINFKKVGCTCMDMIELA
jgi:hypothetical protein